MIKEWQKVKRFVSLSKDFNLGKMGMLLIFLVFLIFAPVTLPASANSITGCTKIVNAGYYTLENDIIDSNAPICINITSSDVIFDGAGHTLDGIGSVNSFGVYAYGGNTGINNVTVKNLEVTDWMYGIIYINVDGGRIENNILKSDESGILLSFSNSITISNNTANSNENGVWLLLSSGNIIVGNIAKSNEYGFLLTYSSGNTISNNTAKSNDYGFYLEISSDQNNISNNIVSSNGCGISLFFSGGSIWNNYFNNTKNVKDLVTHETKWNTTKTPGSNIVGGSYLGGNYWAKPDGTGFSQTCSDGDGDWICDEGYELAASNIDYLPLKKPTLTPTPPAPIPEFPTVVLPALAVVALLSLFQRQKHR